LWWDDAGQKIRGVHQVWPNATEGQAAELVLRIWASVSSRKGQQALLRVLVPYPPYGVGRLFTYLVGFSWVEGYICKKRLQGDDPTSFGHIDSRAAWADLLGLTQEKRLELAGETGVGKTGVRVS
jgi:hypothetical protein